MRKECRVGDAGSLGVLPNSCFVAHFAYGAIAGGHSGSVGGVERQTLGSSESCGTPQGAGAV